MFLPNTFGHLSSREGRNRYAEPVFGEPKRVECAVVRLREGIKATSVRADSSASRGSAEEIVTDAKILFPQTVDAKIGDRFTIAGISLEIVSREIRIDVFGRVDHLECEMMVLPQ